MSARTTNLDHIVAARPVDRTTALVTGCGEHWDPERPKDWPAASYDAPPRLSRWLGQGDLSGTTYGRLTVIGLLRELNGWSLWLVRCACGAYEDRTGRAIAGKVAGACWRCDRLQRMQEGRTLEPVVPKRRPKPTSTVEVVLAAPSVRRAARKEPRTAMQAALSEALARKAGTG